MFKNLKNLLSERQDEKLKEELMNKLRLKAINLLNEDGI